MDVEQAAEIIVEIKKLKLLLIKAQEYESATIMREMEKKYLDMKVN